MSCVYQGRDQATNSDVAMKVLTPRLAADAASVQRLKREALLAERFDHPNVCRILHVGETSDGMLYLTMPYLRGESLNDSETRRGPYPVGEAVLLLVQVCQGLQHAHDLGVIHRDLKPENIMLVPDDTVPGGIRAVVMDFGLGKAIQPDPDLVRLTQTGIILGTPEFMSPEQVRGEKIDASERHLRARYRGVRALHRAAAVRGKDVAGVDDVPVAGSPPRGAVSAA